MIFLKFTVLSTFLCGIFMSSLNLLKKMDCKYETYFKNINKQMYKTVKKRKMYFNNCSYKKINFKLKGTVIND